ncbi:glucokinase [Marilutibacter chinensis]|uniref:Glucokinase n=1 Tax=Marilutibacter chinensis TaxID=2912247 RepID=A0ABS9HVH5_9GAMM|nr:glucokinase [Lysobacter chinensis]MCF7222891.1 glucokinase [Lysobacter chinensis]
MHESSSASTHDPSALGEVSPDAVLVGDIGGTNARFALADIAGPAPLMHAPLSLANADFASLRHAIEHYLALTGARPRRAAIAVASPVGHDEIRLTNRAWSFSQSELRESLGLERLRMVNDFGAVAWSVPALQENDRVHLYGPVDPPGHGPVSVLGPGTGLGVGMLAGSVQAGWQVVETEGGHASFAPLGEEEEAIARWLAARHGRVSNERLLCGQGLSCIDAVLRGEPPGREATMRAPADVVALALDGHDQAARRALARFCAVLGSVAGDIALIHGARCVTIAGGMVPRFLPFLRSSAFRERFLAKGRFVAYLEAIAVQVIVHPYPGLLGAAMSMRGNPAD